MGLFSYIHQKDDTDRVTAEPKERRDGGTTEPGQGGRGEYGVKEAKRILRIKDGADYLFYCAEHVYK